MSKEQNVLPPVWLSELQVFALWLFTEKQKQKQKLADP